MTTEEKDVGVYLIEELRSVGALSETLSESLEQEYNQLLTESQNTPHKYVYQGVEITWEHFKRVYTDYLNYPTADDVLQGLGLSASILGIDKDSLRKRLRAMRKHFSTNNPEAMKMGGLPSVDKRKKMYGVGAGGEMPEADIDNIDPGRRGQRRPSTRIIDRINDQAVVSGEFYNDYSRIPRRRWGSWIRFWERQIGRIKNPKKLLGRVWGKSFMLGFQFEKSLVIEIWYNSATSDFSIYDQNGAELGRPTKTLQETVRFFVNFLVRESERDADIFSSDTISGKQLSQSYMNAIGKAIGDDAVEKQREAELQAREKSKEDIGIKATVSNSVSSFKQKQAKKKKEFDKKEQEREEKKREAEQNSRKSQDNPKTSTSSGIPHIDPDDAKNYADTQAKEREDEIKARKKERERQRAVSAEKANHHQKEREKEAETKSGEVLSADEFRDAMRRAKTTFDKTGRRGDTISLGKDDYEVEKKPANLGLDAPKAKKDNKKKVKQSQKKTNERERDFKRDGVVKNTGQSVEELEAALVDKTEELEDIRAMVGNESDEAREIRKELLEIRQLLKKARQADKDGAASNMNDIEQTEQAIKDNRSRLKSLKDQVSSIDAEINSFGRGEAMDDDERVAVQELKKQKSKVEQQLDAVKTAVTGAEKSIRKQLKDAGIDPDQYMPKDLNESFDELHEQSENDFEGFDVDEAIRDMDREARAVKNMADKSPFTVAAIKTSVMGDMIETYNETRFKRRNLISNFLRAVFKGRSMGIQTPQDDPGFFDRLRGAVLGRNYRADFVIGFSLKGVMNVEIWYITERGRNGKPVSSFYVYDITSESLVRGNLPYYRNAMQVVLAKIGVQ